MKIKVNISNQQRKIKLPENTRKLIKSACKATLVLEGFDDNAEVNVSFVDDVQIKELNNAYRNIDSSTDVLSFPLGEDGVYDINPENGNLMLGDVIISIEHAFEQANLYGHGVDREISFLTVHSMLHLLGYDHVNGGDEERTMRKKEEEILDSIGLAVS